MTKQTLRQSQHTQFCITRHEQFQSSNRNIRLPHQYRQCFLSSWQWPTQSVAICCRNGLHWLATHFTLGECLYYCIETFLGNLLVTELLQEAKLSLG